jgi:hypothetical protein
MDNVIDLQAEKDRRAVADLLRAGQEFKGFEHDIALGKRDVIFTGHALGGAHDTQLTVIAYSRADPDGVSRPIGAMRFNPTQWAEFVEFGSGMLEAHLSMFNDNK